MNKLIILLMFLFVTFLGQNINKEITKTYTLTPKSKLIIKGEIDVIIENWNKDKIAIDAKLDLDIKSILTFSTQGKHDIIVTKEGDAIKIIRTKPKSNISLGSFYKDRSKVEISMPDWVSLDADIDDASFFADQLSNDVEIKGDDGDIVINGLSGNKNKISFDDGTFKCKKVSGLLILDFNDGTTKIDRSECSKLIAHYDDGSLRITLGEYARKTYLEFNDGSARINLLDESLFHVSAEKGDGNVRNRTELELTRKSESDMSFGNPDASNLIEVWFDDGTLTLDNEDY